MRRLDSPKVVHIQGGVTMIKQFSGLVAGVSLILASSQSFALPHQSNYVPGEVLVKFREGVRGSRSVLLKLKDALEIQSVKRIAPGTDRVLFNERTSVESAVAELRRMGEVEYAHPNYILRVFPTQTEIAMPTLSKEDPVPCIFPGIPFPPGCVDNGGGGGGGGGVPGVPGGGGGSNPRPPVADAPAENTPAIADPDLAKAYGLSKTGAIDAWKVFNGSKKMIVADIDTGVDYNHEDLSFNMWRNPSPTNNDVVGFDFIHNDGLPFDDQGHGTHTSGTIGATGGNGKGVSGVAPRVSIMALKFLSAQGSGTTADAIKAIDYAIAHGAKVLSNSWGGEGDEDNASLYAAVERAKAADVLFIAAAGNGGSDQVGDDNDSSPHKAFPAAFDNDNLIAVAATDNTDKLAFFSNFGKVSTDLAAPGVNIHSTVPKNGYKSNSGTSMACPHVAGAAALVWAKNPTWNYQQVKKALLDSVDQVPSLAGKTVTGGRLNVLKALSIR